MSGPQQRRAGEKRDLSTLEVSLSCEFTPPSSLPQGVRRWGAIRDKMAPAAIASPMEGGFEGDAAASNPNRIADLAAVLNKVSSFAMPCAFCGYIVCCLLFCRDSRLLARGLFVVSLLRASLSLD